MKKVSILGCGWLGFPLAETLLKEGYQVKGSTTSPSMINQLTKVGIEAFLIALTEEKVEGNIAEFLKETDTLIIDIPPGLRKNPKEDFVKKMTLLFIEVEKSKVKHVVYVSSTSVFEDGESIPTYNENDIPNANSSAGQQLIEVEKLWQNSDKFKTTIVRFGGLVGEDRHPVNYLAGRENIQNPHAPVNLIEQIDAMRLLIRLVEKSIAGIFHGVYPDHPSREIYYSAAAKKRGLEPPIFDQATNSNGKKIDTKQTCLLLAFKFLHQP